MTKNEATSLVVFINRCSTCYQAEVLPIGYTNAWVILTDRKTGANPPAIMEAAAYLADDRIKRTLAQGCRELLENWLEEWQDGDGGYGEASLEDLRSRAEGLPPASLT